MKWQRRCADTAGGRSRFRPGAPIRASLDPRGGGECRAVTAWPPRLGPQRWIGGPPIARKARAPETGSPPGAERNRSINTARGTPWVWRTCGLPAVARKSVGGPDFDKPRCREASRSAGPIGPLASRAPSVLFPGAVRKGTTSVPDARTKNTGGGAMPCRRPGRAQRGPGPILRSLSRGHGVWVPAFAGTTRQRFRT